MSAHTKKAFLVLPMCEEATVDSVMDSSGAGDIVVQQCEDTSAADLPSIIVSGFRDFASQYHQRQQQQSQRLQGFIKEFEGLFTENLTATHSMIAKRSEHIDASMNDLRAQLMSLQESVRVMRRASTVGD